MSDDGDEGAGPGLGVEGRIVRVLPAGTMEGVAVEAYLEAAAAAGFEWVSLRPRGVRAWHADGPGRTLAGLAERLRALGLGVAELDPVAGWDDPRRWPSATLPTDVLEDLDLAAAVGARAVTALVLPGEPWDPAVGAEGLAVLAASAAERGLLVQIEPFGWSALWDVTAAMAVVEQVGATNAGVLVDTWHLDRRGGGVATVDALPVGRVLGLQVSDGPSAPTSANLQQDCFGARTWPGDPAGELHPERILGSLLRRGWSGPVSVEVFGDALADPAGRARHAAAALDAMLATIRR